MGRLKSPCAGHQIQFCKHNFDFLLFTFSCGFWHVIKVIKKVCSTIEVANQYVYLNDYRNTGLYEDNLNIKDEDIQPEVEFFEDNDAVWEIGRGNNNLKRTDSEFSLGLSRNKSTDRLLSELGPLCSTGRYAFFASQVAIYTSLSVYGFYWYSTKEQRKKEG